jgi:hypothetical protein
MSEAEQQFVTGFGGAISPDGRIGQIECLRANGTRTYFQFPMAAAGSIITLFHRAVGSLFEKQRELIRGADPRNIFPMGVMHLKSVQGAAGQGKPILSLVTREDVRLDFWLDPASASDLIQWLQGLSEAARSPPATRN